MSFLSFGCFGIFEDLMMSAAVTFVFYGFLHCGEFTVTSQAAFRPHRSLCMQDIVFYPTMDSPDYMTVRFKFSKTDPFGKGHTVTIHTTHTLTCPVRAIGQYLRARQYRPDVPILVLADGTILIRSKFINKTRVLLTKVGLRAELYAGHSFRIGAATTAAVAGLPDWLIQAMGHWSSNCYKRYIRITNASLKQACRDMAASSHVW